MDAGFGGMLDGKSPLGKPRRKWEYNIEIYLKRNMTGCYGLDLCCSEYGRVEGSCGHGNEPSGSIKC
jgi:hypothetical protein